MDTYSGHRLEKHNESVHAVDMWRYPRVPQTWQSTTLTVDELNTMFLAKLSTVASWPGAPFILSYAGMES